MVHLYSDRLGGDGEHLGRRLRIIHWRPLAQLAHADGEAGAHDIGAALEAPRPIGIERAFHIRVARQFRTDRLSVRAILDVFNIMNANTALVRVNNITSTTFNALAQNLSPRIARIGMVVGF